jgi:EF-hand domain pair
LDTDANTARILSDQFQSINGSLILSKTYHAFETRVTEQEWIDAVNAAYKASGLSTKKQVPVPMVGNCLEKVCPTEEDWCSQDPECSTSPFQEPKASLKAGALSGFIIAGIVILLALCFAVHRWLSSRQIKRYKTIFAKRIAETISVNKSFRSMEPEELAEEFKKVDLQTEDGLITKDDLWEFISSGKAGEISESDFNALFAAIDSDGDGQVDFLAFCAFMGQW